MSLFSPYVLTEEEIGELRPGAVEAEAMEGRRVVVVTKRPHCSSLCSTGPVGVRIAVSIKPEPIVEEALVAADTVLGALVSSLHGDVLAMRPSVEVSRAGNANTVILRLPVESCGIDEREEKACRHQEGERRRQARSLGRFPCQSESRPTLARQEG